MSVEGKKSYETVKTVRPGTIVKTYSAGGKVVKVTTKKLYRLVNNRLVIKKRKRIYKNGDLGLIINETRELESDPIGGTIKDLFTSKSFKDGLNEYEIPKPGNFILTRILPGFMMIVEAIGVALIEVHQWNLKKTKDKKDRVHISSDFYEDGKLVKTTEYDRAMGLHIELDSSIDPLFTS